MGLRKKISNKLTEMMTCPKCKHNDETYLTATDCKCDRSDCACAHENGNVK